MRDCIIHSVRHDCVFTKRIEIADARDREEGAKMEPDMLKAGPRVIVEVQDAAGKRLGKGTIVYDTEDEAITEYDRLTAKDGVPSLVSMRGFFKTAE